MAWWRHAINATRHACRGIRRHQAPLRTIERRRRERLAYQALYAAARCGLPSFEVSSHKLAVCSTQYARDKQEQRVGHTLFPDPSEDAVLCRYQYHTPMTARTLSQQEHTVLGLNRITLHIILSRASPLQPSSCP